MTTNSTTFTVSITGDGQILDSTTSYSLATAGVTPTPEPIRGRFDLLDDVVEAGTANTGMVPVYNKDSDLYEIKDVDLDGGEY